MYKGCFLLPLKFKHLGDKLKHASMKKQLNFHTFPHIDNYSC
jgi:hypothetical protein